MKIKHKQIEVGDTFQTTDGGTLTVVKYSNSREVVVKSNDKYAHMVTVRASQLRSGKVKNPYHSSVYGVGFIGVGEHRAWINGKQSPAYATWNKMLQRCYDSKYHAKQQTYIGCTVHEDWHNFQNFAEWFEQQYRADGWHLDKDLIVEGNRVYSSDACAFVPQQLNGLLNDNGNVRGDLPQGVSRHGKGYRAELSVDGKRQRLGTHTTPEKAFQAYKLAKESNVKRMAEQYKGLIDPRVYESLMRYEV